MSSTMRAPSRTDRVGGKVQVCALHRERPRNALPGRYRNSLLPRHRDIAFMDSIVLLITDPVVRIAIAIVGLPSGVVIARRFLPSTKADQPTSCRPRTPLNE